MINFATVKNNQLFYLIDRSDFEKEVSLNINGNFYLIQLILKKMIKKNWGRFIHISSRGAEITDKGTLTYSIAKNSILSMSSVLAKEYGKFNITSNVISLGTFEIGLVKGLSKDKIKNLLNTIPLKKFIDIKEINYAVEYLQKSKFVNGAKIIIDGGAY